MVFLSPGKSLYVLMNYWTKPPGKFDLFLFIDFYDFRMCSCEELRRPPQKSRKSHFWTKRTDILTKQLAGCFCHLRLSLRFSCFGLVLLYNIVIRLESFQYAQLYNLMVLFSISLCRVPHFVWRQTLLLLFSLSQNTNACICKLSFVVNYVLLIIFPLPPQSFCGLQSDTLITSVIPL